MTTFARLVGPLWYPSRWYYNNDSEVAQDTKPIGISAAGTKVAYMFQVPRTGTLDGIGFATWRMTLAHTFIFSWQDIDPATGFPDGQVDQSGTVNVSAGIYEWSETGSIPRTVTAGDWLAAVWSLVTYKGGFTELAGILGAVKQALPYVAVHNGTSWSLNSAAIHPCMALRYDDGSYEVPLGLVEPERTEPLFGDAANRIRVGGDRDEVGIVFSLLMPMEIDGAAVYVHAAGNGVLTLYAADGTVLRTAPTTATFAALTTTLRMPQTMVFEPLTLTANTTYRLTWRATTADLSRCYLHRFSDPGPGTHAPRSAWYGGTAFGTYIERVGGGAWLEDPETTLSAFLFVLGLAVPQEEEEEEEEEEIVTTGPTSVNVLLVQSTLKGRWVVHDHPVLSLLTEEDTDLLTAGFGDGIVYDLEQGTDDAGAAIALATETKDFAGGSEDTLKLFLWVRLDLETATDTILAALYVDGALMRTVPLVQARDPALIPFPAGSLGFAWRVQLTYSGRAAVKVYGVGVIFQRLRGPGG